MPRKPARLATPRRKKPAGPEPMPPLSYEEGLEAAGASGRGESLAEWTKARNLRTAANADLQREMERRKAEESARQEVYANAPTLELPHLPPGLVPGGETPGPFEVGLRTRSTGGRARIAGPDDVDRAHLWVIPEAGHEDIHRLASSPLTPREIDKLSVAQVGNRVVVRSHDLANPPVLNIPNAIPFTEAGQMGVGRLPGVYFPADSRLYPQIRPSEAVATLHHRPGHVTWLFPHGAGGGFHPESIPQSLFRPLTDLIEYTSPTPQKVPDIWQQQHHWDLEGFREPQDALPPPAPRPEVPDAPLPTIPPARTRPARTRPAAPPAPAPVARPATRRVTPDRLREEKQQLEEEFRNSPLPLDDPARGPQWLALADVTGRMGDRPQAAVFYQNALWGGDDPAARWGWLRSEDPAARPLPTAEEFDADMSRAEPSEDDMRRLAARIVQATGPNANPAGLLSRLPQVTAYLDQHEHVLGFRALWLARHGLARVSGDVLSLARVRDRMLDRLYQGDNRRWELDLPAFLRTARGPHQAQAQARLHELAPLVRQWHREPDVFRPGSHPTSVHEPFRDLALAYGHARLGDPTAARQLLESARPRLAGRDSVRDWLFGAFSHRIEEALAGKPAGAWPAQLMEQYGRLDGPSRRVVDTYREKSPILEPMDRIDSSAQTQTKLPDSVAGSYVAAQQITDPAQLAREVDGWINRAGDARGKLSAAGWGLRLAARMGDSYAGRLLDRLPGLAASVPDEAGRATSSGSGTQDSPSSLIKAKVLAEGAHLAGHFGRPDLAERLFEQGLAAASILRAPKDRYGAMVTLADRALTGLEKSGRRDLTERALTRLTDLVMGGQTISQFQAQLDDPRAQADGLGALLHLAGQWARFGRPDRAQPALDAARQTLLDPNSLRGQPIMHSILLHYYMQAIGQMPPEEASRRYQEVLRSAPALPNAMSTAAWFSHPHIGPIESMVQGLAGENLALGPDAVRYRDENEMAIRRRVHGDMRQALQSAQL